MDNSFDSRDLCYDMILNILSECDKQKKTESSESSLDVPKCFQIIYNVRSILDEEPAVLQINTKKKGLDFVIVGDIHGSLETLAYIFKEKGYPPTTRYLFLGDYVDRGTKSCEVLMLLFSLKCLYPNDIYLIRGNHEFRKICDSYGFRNECFNRIKTTYINDICFTGLLFYKAVVDTFTLLPICAILDNSIFCVHGGITSYVKNRAELLKLKKVGSQLGHKDNAQAEMLWNDPDIFTSKYNVSKRGRGSIFGKEAVDEFLSNMNFKLVIRGHQSVINGYDWPFGQKGGILTVFSAMDYKKTSNKAGIAVILKENDIENLQLVSVHQIKKISQHEEVNNCLSYPLDINESY